MINRLIVGLVPTLQKGKYVEGKGQVRILYSYTENTIVSMTLDDYKMIDMYYKDALPELGSELLAVLKNMCEYHLNNLIDKIPGAYALGPF